MKKLKKGFTIIELMIVLAILGIIAAIALPPILHYFGVSTREGQHAVRCTSEE